MSEFEALNVLGMMSGTSLDGVDLVLARLEPATPTLRWQVLARHALDYPDALKTRIRDAMQPHRSDVVLITELDAELGRFFAAAARDFLTRHPADTVDLVALSGQTVYHIPHADAARGWQTPSTLQLGDASFVADATGLPVMADFRSGDLAAGGQGAPLVPFADLQLYYEPGVARAVHNIGGISNVTYLPADGDPNRVIAFDTGPGNCLIDEATQHYFGAPYDADGRLAARGRINADLLGAFLSHPYFDRPPPKSTGREMFSLHELAQAVDFVALTFKDVLATLTALTAESVERAYRQWLAPHGLDEVLLAGGGAYNETLVAMLRQRLDMPVKTFEQLGYQPKDREALAFAVLAYFSYHQHPNTLPQTTGARHAVLAGKLSRPPQPK